MSDLSSAIHKAARLLRLATSDNPHEAALAAARAQEIIDRYKLTEQDLELDAAKREREPEEPIRGFENPLGSGFFIWRSHLAFVVAEANQCMTYVDSSDRTIRLVGRPSDAEAVRYLFAYLEGEVERLTKRDARGNGFTWANNFRIGCVQTIRQRLQGQHKETVLAVRKEATDALALVRIDSAIERLEKRRASVEEFARKTFGVKTVNRNVNTNQQAREAGKRAGREIELKASGGSLTGGHRALGGGK